MMDTTVTAHVWADHCRRCTVDRSESEYLVIDSISFFKRATVDSHVLISCSDVVVQIIAAG